MKNILATGAIGLVGSRFVEMFKDKYLVSNIDILSGVDITDKQSIRKFVAEHQADVLIHLAAFTDTNKAWEEKGDTEGICYRVNVLGTKNLLEVCKEFDIHLVHISTDYVFDGQKKELYTETDPTSPLEWYGETKAIAEQIIIDSHSSATILRISYPYRAKTTTKPDLIQKIRDGLKSGNLPPQFSDTLITPTFIDDIARAFDRVIELKPSGIFHCTGSSSLSPYTLAQLVAQGYGYDKNIVKEGKLSDYQKTVSRPFAKYVTMSNQKAISELGLEFATFEDGLTEVLKQQNL